MIELPADAGEPSAVPKLPPDRRAALEAQLAELIKARDALTPDDNFTPKGFQTRTRLAMLRFRLASYKPDGTPRTYAMGVRERFEPLDSPLYIRGELDQPGELVPRGLVQVLSPKTPPTITKGSGRRELAELAGLARQPPDGPRDGQPDLAPSVRPRAGPHARQFRRRRPAAQPPRAARHPGGLVHGPGLVGQEADPPDRPQPGLSARARRTTPRASRSTPTTRWSGG